ncbi:RNA methyltransferase, partial [Xanthomonas citri pv. citri]
QQILAVVKARPNEFPAISKNRWTLLLDGIQDPGNLGSIIRIADWFGIAAIYCTPETADHYNTKVVLATMGSLWRVPVYYGDCKALLSKAMVPVYGTLLEGGNIFAGGILAPGIIVIGSEGQGIHPSILPFITKAITIPKLGHAESLNAAVAAG